jgi:hypothetical protein
MPDNLYETDILTWSEHQADLLRRAAAAPWAAEVLGFLADAQRSFSPSMRQRIDLAGLYGTAVRQAQAEARGQSAPDLPLTCPFVLDDLLADRPDVAALVQRLQNS